MKTVYLVRHGESRANVRGSKYYEGSESPLTEKGLQQAEDIAERSSKLPVDLLVASTMVRAQQTASAISKRIDMPVVPSELFVERLDPTSLIGRPWDDPETQRIYKEWDKTSFLEAERVLDGENFEDLKDRAQRALKFLEAREESHILVVTHGLFLRILVACVLFGEDLSAKEYKRFFAATLTQNTGITVLRFMEDTQVRVDILARQGWVLYVFNDHAHLG
jgi:probable phosphoglycerate mutase